MNTTAEAGTEESRAHAIRRSERDTAAFAHAARHSRRVRVLKVILPTAALVIAGLFVGYTMLPDIGVDIRTATVEGGDLVLENPTLDGFTDDKLPYSVTAARARQAEGLTAGIFDLEEISGFAQIDVETRAEFEAAGGRYNRDGGHVRLDDDIVVRTTSGLVARLQSADIDFDTHKLETDDPVEVEMDGMRIEANAFRASDGGKSLVFEDRVKIRIDPARVRHAQGENGESGGNE